MTVEKVVYQVNHRNFSSAQLNDCKTEDLLWVAACSKGTTCFVFEDRGPGVKSHLVAAGLPTGLTAKEGALQACGASRQGEQFIRSIHI
jgi:hypothetical protein